MSSNTQANLLNMQNTLPWQTYYLEQSGECDFCGLSESPIGLDLLVDPSAPRRLLKISGCVLITLYLVAIW